MTRVLDVVVHGVAPRGLGRVEGLVGALEQVDRVARRGGLGDAGAQADGDVGGQVGGALGHGHAQPVAHLVRDGQRRRQHQRELVAAQARGQVGLAALGLQVGRDPAQRGVAGQVAIAVVDGLEVVEVDQHQRHRMLVAGARQHAGQELVEAAPVGQAGELVVARLEVRALGAVALLADLAQRALGAERHHQRGGLLLGGGRARAASAVRGSACAPRAPPAIRRAPHGPGT